MDEKRIKEFEILLKILKKVSPNDFITVNRKTFLAIQNKTDWITVDFDKSQTLIRGIPLAIDEEVSDYKLGI